MEITKMTRAEWLAGGTRRFGEDVALWRFVCPSCGHVASVKDYQDAGAPQGAVGFSCIGRYLPEPVGGTKGCFDKSGGPCCYAGGGLFRLNPVHVTDEQGEIHQMFAFGEAVGS